MLCLKKIKFVCLPLLSLFLCLFLSHSASAVDGSTTINITENWNTYYDTQWHYNVSDGAVAVPHNLLNQNATYTKALSWFRFRTSFPNTENYLGDSRNMYNVVTIRFRTTNNAPSGASWTNLNLETFDPYLNYSLSDGSTGSVKCEYNNLGVTLEIDCSIRTREYTQVTSFDFRSGPTSSSTDILSTLQRGSMGTAVILTRIYVAWTGTADPSIDYLDDINQNITTLNESINNLNESVSSIDTNMSEVNDNLEQINDTLTDSTVTGDFSMPDVPAFGPIATILNSLIDLPRVFLNPGQCQDLVGPMPVLTDQNFVIPCPKRLLQPFWDAVVVIENFFAAYIWFRTAVYIGRQVKKLRDPTNDDEEFLDI